MQVTEFYSDKATYCKEWFDGRWLWYSVLKTSKFDGGIEWLDLFGKHPDTRFLINNPDLEYTTKPLTRHFVLLQSTNGAGEHGVQVMELDWANVSYTLGSMVREEKQHCKLLVDRHCQDDNLQFLLFEEEGNQIDCDFWRLIAKERQIEHIGRSFQLSRDKFKCFNLNNSIVTGISSSLETISTFDLVGQRMLSEIKLNGLPKSVDIRKSIDACVLDNRQFYFSLTEGSLEERCSTIYCTDLDTGHVKAFTNQFDGRIIKMSIELDRRLYVQLEKLLPEKGQIIMPDGFRVDCLMPVNLNSYRFFRISIEEPESLLFMSIVANKTSLPTNIQKILNGKDYIPKGIYEDFKLVYFVGARFK